MTAPASQSSARLALSVVERFLMPIVFAFVAAVVLGVTVTDHGMDGHPRTVNFQTHAPSSVSAE